MSPALAALALLAGCATGPTLSETQRQQIYFDHAGAPVNKFSYFGTLHSWEPIGDDALVVWTRPSDAYLLRLASACPRLDVARSISLSDQTGAVFAGLDNVVVLDQSTSIPCRIETIQPLDVKAIRQAEDVARASL
ncbi:hypothetical protein N799_05940 [Lysobacter arseniciresistens ZS79]|uniref:Uncharacterized protein n=1 Tax=Lysobacter arseniciresistens ZS79 TaxID=913325 RepID=A0A0A0F425_9GAMM|nr:hypothetical protein N799_05940 [Lysobacter arseniciresistens ZS79]